MAAGICQARRTDQRTGQSACFLSGISLNKCLATIYIFRYNTLFSVHLEISLSPRMKCGEKGVRKRKRRYTDPRASTPPSERRSALTRRDLLPEKRRRRGNRATHGAKRQQVRAPVKRSRRQRRKTRKCETLAGGADAFIISLYAKTRESCIAQLASFCYNREYHKIRQRLYVAIIPREE